MSSVAAWDDLHDRLTIAAITYNGTLLPIAWPNQTFRAPAPIAPWLMIEMTGGASQPIELGGTTWLVQGQSMVHVMVPTGTGVVAALDVVDQVAAMFRRPTTGNVYYVAVTADPGGAGTDDGSYWRTSVTGDWQLQNYVVGS